MEKAKFAPLDIMDFLDAHLAKKNIPYLKSEKGNTKVKKTSKKFDEPVFTFTGNNHDNIIKETEADIVVVYCNNKA
eukprot:CAMPEP_0170543002 /NCGR_PEP_ID=MMETSP0211-20121228/2254_1 /TAXON_ID=311385 /ORGANISM="Pseudokeronopsis sp., Strain OXSARD2" /LENGTH=75 /DNA_ID=CAMNT_0010846255 /DNA_START=1020 /DNA_END=1247 /DNA_ORIENTATION=+